MLRIIRSPFPTDRVSLCETTVTCGTWLIINLSLISRKLQVHIVSRPYPRTKESVTIAKVALLLCCFKNPEGDERMYQRIYYSGRLKDEIVTFETTLFRVGMS